MIAEGGPVRDDLSVTGLVTRARNGDQQAWDALVERYAPLIWSICRRHRLGGADANDVGQSVWLHLVDQLDRIRDPAALPGWLATTTRRECVRMVREIRGPLAAGQVPDGGNIPDQAQTAEQELLVAERHAALREAFTYLPPGDQQLITLLIQDPPVPYTQISARLGISVGSIGPNRRRCLDKLRRHPALAALIDTETGTAADQAYRQKVMHR
jgi:RNA polymerase sigma factor (sigma-70 family)